MRDFSCCGHTLPTLHDLLQHYEECHAQQTPQSLRTAAQQQQSRDQQQPNSKAAIASQAASSVQQQAQQQRQLQQAQLNRAQNTGFGANKVGGVSSLSGGIQQMRQQQSQPSTPKQSMQSSADDMDGVNDMEMDDPVGPLDPVDTPIQRSAQPAQQSMFGQQQRQNNLTNTGGILHQGLRNNQPATPAATGFGFQNNPTVSSVNTPTLSAQPQQNTPRFSPNNSTPGTPAEMDDDFSGMNMDMSNIGNMNMNTNMNNMNFPYGFGNDLGLDLCIDEPAKRLFSPNGGFGNQRALQQQFAQFGLGQGQFANNDDLVRRLRQQQMMQMQGFGNGTGMMMAGEEHKPFRCPVIGCEKAYKNQNGLKYV